MALAMLELSITPSGDVLEQLLVITIAEAATMTPRIGSGAVSRIRLLIQVDDMLPGVPSTLRAQLEHAASCCLEQLARRDSET
ncbi:MAG: hypothetical protein DI592_13810, partial [Stenotrophomonas maltophilia]